MFSNASKIYPQTKKATEIPKIHRISVILLSEFGRETFGTAYQVYKMARRGKEAPSGTRTEPLNIHGYSVDLLRELGRGAFGTVYRGNDSHGNNFAIKRVCKSDKKMASKEAFKLHFMKENICHENVIDVLDVKTHGDSMWIFMEFCDLGDLNQFF